MGAGCARRPARRMSSRPAAARSAPAVEARVRRCVGALQDLARPACAAVPPKPACAPEGVVVEPVVQAAVEFGEPGQRGLVEHHRPGCASSLHARPGAQEVLHREVEPLAVLQLVAQAAEQREVGQPLLEEDLRRARPSSRCSPRSPSPAAPPGRRRAGTGRCRARACFRRTSGRSGRRAARAPPSACPARSCAIRSVM